MHSVGSRLRLGPRARPGRFMRGQDTERTPSYADIDPGCRCLQTTFKMAGILIESQLNIGGQGEGVGVSAKQSQIISIAMCLFIADLCRA
jgi:hypothetical protein